VRAQKGSKKITTFIRTFDHQLRVITIPGSDSRCCMDTAGGKGQAKSFRNHLELFRYSMAGRKDVVGGRRPKEADDDRHTTGSCSLIHGHVIPFMNFITFMALQNSETRGQRTLLSSQTFQIPGDFYRSNKPSDQPVT